LYKIKEIFGPTIQGEGSHAGEAVMFIRFTGCNKWSGRDTDKPKSICKFCDTDFVGGEVMNPIQIVMKLQELSKKVTTVVLSGGEPMLQVDEQLLKNLTLMGYSVHLETNGSLAMTPEMRKLITHISCSPKQAPAKTLLKEVDDLKILYPYISDEITFEAFAQSQIKYKQGYVQPVMDNDYSLNLHKAVRKVLLNPWLKLSIQQHKIIGVQ
jgi:organic radical activating enzyme